MRRNTIPTSAAVALVAALATLASGCGASSLDPVAKAAAATSDRGSAKVQLSVTTSGGPASTALSGSGAFSKDGSRLSLEVQTGGKTLPFDELFVGAPAQPVVYVRSPVFASMLPAGKSWLKVDLGALAKQHGVDLGSLGSASQSPSDTLGMLEQSGDVRKVGTDTIDGVETTHYHATIDLAKVAASQPGGKAALDQALKPSGLKTIPADVWIDGNGLVRREQTTVAVSTPQGKTSVQTTMTLSDYGTPVDVAPPPDDQVATLPSLGG